MVPLWGGSGKLWGDFSTLRVSLRPFFRQGGKGGPKAEGPAAPRCHENFLDSDFGGGGGVGRLSPFFLDVIVLIRGGVGTH